MSSMQWCVLEQMGGLVVDLERVGVVEQIEIEQLGHSSIVLQTNTSAHTAC